MALSKSQKVTALQKFENIVAMSPSLVFLQVTGVPVHEVDTLRNQLRNTQGGYIVAKKNTF